MDNKALLLIRLKKYPNPHENSCSKVISMLVTGYSLHESSSAPQQHKSVQYKMVCFVLTPRCFAYRHAATTFYQLQRGFRDRRQHERIQDFCQFYLVLSLFYSLKRGSNGFIAEKLYLYFTKNPEAVHYLPGAGGVQLFPGGGGGGGFKCLFL